MENEMSKTKLHKTNLDTPNQNLNLERESGYIHTGRNEPATLYVFHVDTGTMMTFDMNLAMESVASLQRAIVMKHLFPEDKQVLLTRDGERMDPNAAVGKYDAGKYPPSPNVHYGSESLYHPIQDHDRSFSPKRQKDIMIKKRKSRHKNINSRVYIDGDGIGKDCHMSLFNDEMRGLFDSTLPWPFYQNNQITLIMMIIKKRKSRHKNINPHVYTNGDGIGKDCHMSLFNDEMRGLFDSTIPWPFYQNNQIALIMMIIKKRKSRHKNINPHVYTNGDGIGKDCHMSLFNDEMRGLFDSTLPWPFYQNNKITLIMLMIKMRKSRHKNNKPDTSSAKQETTKLNIASGYPMFTSLRNLDTVQETDFKILVDENKSLKDVMCKMCGDTTTDVFPPCGHLEACLTCRLRRRERSYFDQYNNYKNRKQRRHPHRIKRKVTFEMQYLQYKTC